MKKAVSGCAHNIMLLQYLAVFIAAIFKNVNILIYNLVRKLSSPDIMFNFKGPLITLLGMQYNHLPESVKIFHDSPPNIFP
jgi:hypothetical protein